MSSNCNICSCKEYVPNRWKTTLCSSCYHSISNHTIKLEEPLINDILEKPKVTYVRYVYELFSMYTLYFFSMFYRLKNE
jgi:hypothetical protein